MSDRLRDRVAVVTGAESGIGRAIAIELAREGADVAVAWFRDRPGGEATCREVEAVGRQAFLHPLDQRDPASVTALFDAAGRALGTPLIVVNAAAVPSAGKPVAELATDAWDSLLQANLSGPFYCCQQFVRARKAAGGRGRIINITSVHQDIAQPGSAAYDASKAGLRHFTRTLALELAPDRINVNCIAPGMILTPMNQAVIDDPAQLATAVRCIPWGRAGEPREVAKLAVYLASDDADYVTGQSFTIDGGLTLTVGQGA